MYDGTEVKLKVTPAGMPSLPEGAEEFQRLPKKGYYTLDNFPKNMRGKQTCAKDVWACVLVNKGKLRYKALTDLAVLGEEGLAQDKELTYTNGGAIVPPQIPFEIAPVDGEKKLEFRIVYNKVPSPEAGDQDVVTASPAGGGGVKGKNEARKYSFKWGGNVPKK